MSLAILIIHVLACVGIILVVLLQTGKGAAMGAAFGGSSQTVFGSAGATPFLAKLTTGVAVVFMLTSLGLAIFGQDGGPSTLMQESTPAAQSAPAPDKPEFPTQQAAPATPAAPAEKAPTEGSTN